MSALQRQNQPTQPACLQTLPSPFSITSKTLPDAASVLHCQLLLKVFIVNSFICLNQTFKLHVSLCLRSFQSLGNHKTKQTRAANQHSNSEAKKWSQCKICSSSRHQLRRHTQKQTQTFKVGQEVTKNTETQTPKQKMIIKEHKRKHRGNWNY